MMRLMTGSEEREVERGVSGSLRRWREVSNPRLCFSPSLLSLFRRRLSLSLSLSGVWAFEAIFDPPLKRGLKKGRSESKISMVMSDCSSALVRSEGKLPIGSTSFINRGEKLTCDFDQERSKTSSR